jgi:hypothetical protein
MELDDDDFHEDEDGEDEDGQAGFRDYGEWWNHLPLCANDCGARALDEHETCGSAHCEREHRAAVLQRERRLRFGSPLTLHLDDSGPRYCLDEKAIDHGATLDVYLNDPNQLDAYVRGTVAATSLEEWPAPEDWVVLATALGPLRVTVLGAYFRWPPTGQTHGVPDIPDQNDKRSSEESPTTATPPDLQRVCEQWTKLAPGFPVTKKGAAHLAKLLQEHGHIDVVSAMTDATKQYLKLDAKRRPTRESADKAFDYIARIIEFRKSTQDKPYMRAVMYVRGIVKNRFTDCDMARAGHLIEQAHLAGHSFEELKGLAATSPSWSEWRDAMESLLAAD